MVSYIMKHPVYYQYFKIIQKNNHFYNTPVNLTKIRAVLWKV